MLNPDVLIILLLLSQNYGHSFISISIRVAEIFSTFHVSISAASITYMAKTWKGRTFVLSCLGFISLCGWKWCSPELLENWGVEWALKYPQPTVPQGLAILPVDASFIRCSASLWISSCTAITASFFYSTSPPSSRARVSGGYFSRGRCASAHQEHASQQAGSRPQPKEPVPELTSEKLNNEKGRQGSMIHMSEWGNVLEKQGGKAMSGKEKTELDTEERAMPGDAQKPK